MPSRHRKHAKRRINGVNHKGVKILVTCIALLGAAYGVAAGAVGPGLTMTGGDSDQVTCTGSHLAIENRTRTSLDLRCLPSHSFRGRIGADGNTPASDPGTTDPTTPNTDPSSTDPSTPPPDPTTTTTTTQTPTPTTGTWWVPPLSNQPWQWEIDHPLDLSSASDMGTDATLPDGQPAPDPVVYDIDGVENPAVDGVGTPRHGGSRYLLRRGRYRRELLLGCTGGNSRPPTTTSCRRPGISATTSAATPSTS